MKLSMEWLSEFTDIGSTDIKEFCDEMTMSGSKVEGWEELGSDIQNVVAGKLLTVEKHPDSDHLLICTVDVGEEEPRQIVTGAQNVFPGAFVPVAKAPAKLPGGVEIKKGKLRGVESNGMFCSIAELNLTTKDMPDAIEDGILILNEDCKPGDDIKDVLKLSDLTVEFEITPNRPDCLSVIGLAREAGATFDKKVTYHTPTVKGGSGKIEDFISVEVKNSELCPRYTARVVTDVKIAPSPMWLRRRLRASGVRPINNIVDITNYVMLEYGQPMHAFDYACLDGSRIIVREAEEGEQFISLDNIPHTLKEGMLVIADEKKPVALAGIMGGLNSEITDDTKTVVFESACFMGSSVRLTSRALGMRTESSGRFEKGLDPENTYPALQRACELVELLGAGKVTDGIIDVYGKPFVQTLLPLEPERINSLLGLSLSKEEMRNILLKLDFELDGDTIKVPSFRDDVKTMNDIAEEIIRMYGYDTVQSTLFTAKVKTGSLPERMQLREKVNDLLCSLGLYETCTYSFVSPKYYDKIRLSDTDKRRRSVVISNPLGEDTSVMRTLLLPSVLECLARNDNYHSRDVGLFEDAAVYLPDENPEKLPAEPTHIAAAFYGKGDFYRMKSIIGEILKCLRIKGVEYAAKTDDPTFHPGRCAEVRCEGKTLAVFGELHPEVIKNYGFDLPVYAAEIDFESAFALRGQPEKYKPLPKYPAVTRDLALVCDETLEAGKIEKVMKSACPKLLEEIKLFDIYRGQPIAADKKSMAFSLSFRTPDRTLTDEETDKAIKKILGALEKELGITIRA